MRRLTYLIVILAAIYAGYWFIGANRVQASVQAALVEMSAVGWTAEAEVETSGFPSRFDTTLTNVRIGGPSGQWAYEAPFVQALALSYRPTNAILVFPETQRIYTPTDAGNLTATRLRANAVVKPNLGLAFDNLTAEGESLVYASDQGWTLTLEKLLAAARLHPDSDRRYDVYSKLDQIILPENAGTISSVLLQGDVQLQDPLDRTTQEIIVEQIVVDDIRVIWSDVVLAGQGQLDVDASGLPTGQIDLRIENWRDVIPRLVDAGVMDADFARTAMNMGGLLSAGQDTMVLPLKYEDGFGSLGPLPLGPAPILHFTR